MVHDSRLFVKRTAIGRSVERRADDLVVGVVFVVAVVALGDGVVGIDDRVDEDRQVLREAGQGRGEGGRGAAAGDGPGDDLLVDGGAALVRVAGVVPDHDVA